MLIGSIYLSNEFVDLNTLDELDPEVYNSIYCKEFAIDSKELSKTVMVTYSPKYRAHPSKIRQGKIEECFRIMKTEFEARPIYLQ